MCTAAIESPSRRDEGTPHAKDFQELPEAAQYFELCFEVASASLSSNPGAIEAALPAITSWWSMLRRRIQLC